MIPQHRRQRPYAGPASGDLLHHQLDISRRDAVRTEVNRGAPERARSGVAAVVSCASVANPTKWDTTEATPVNTDQPALLEGDCRAIRRIHHVQGEFVHAAAVGKHEPFVCEYLDRFVIARQVKPSGNADYAWI